MADCEFSRDEFAVRIGTAELAPGRLTGTADAIAWDLRYTGPERPVLLLPPRLYSGGFPKAKSLVPLPLARYEGTFSVDGREHRRRGMDGQPEPQLGQPPHRPLRVRAGRRVRRRAGHRSSRW